VISGPTENRTGIAARALLVLLRAYQVYLSPMNFSACRFHPSCSHYAGEAVQRFGARRGVWLAIKRLARCQPFSKGGYDPVPDSLSSSRSGDLQSNSPKVAHQIDHAFQGDAAFYPEASSRMVAVSISRPASGVLTPKAYLNSSDHRATRGQEFAQ